MKVRISWRKTHRNNDIDLVEGEAEQIQIVNNTLYVEWKEDGASKLMGGWSPYSLKEGVTVEVTDG